MTDSLYKLSILFVSCAHHMLWQLTVLKTYSDAPKMVYVANSAHILFCNGAIFLGRSTETTKKVLRNDKKVIKLCIFIVKEFIRLRYVLLEFRC